MTKSSNISDNNRKVRSAVFAGTWYPGNSTKLEATIKKYITNAKSPELKDKLKAIIVPHAGYFYSGQIAAHAFKAIDKNYKNVFLLGPSHRYPLKNASIMNVTHYSTPLGEIPLSPIAKKLLDSPIIDSINIAHENEHSLEIELPFLQVQLESFELIPILVGDIDSSKFQTTLQKHLKPKDLIVVSADLSHFHPYDTAKELDTFTINTIMNLDSKNIFQAEIDAPHAVSTLLKIAKDNGWTPILLSSGNSGDISGEKDEVVGYCAIGFTGN
jgi:hypothetical protein